MARGDLRPCEVRNRLLHALAKLGDQDPIVLGLDKQHRLREMIPRRGWDVLVLFPVQTAGAVPVTRAFEAVLGELLDVEVDILEREKA